ncbi:hypothetical protein B4135_3672 [Caldibacillus debilis]|uniref:Uncharacterized protein n=1 Tax=Caldibacillus debilis TaxID=301148 RepID=A0A150LAH7_9BACI|nr:hypothetical protein B4135_3672 [Caldibacillus debilis]
MRVFLVHPAIILFTGKAWDGPVRALFLSAPKSEGGLHIKELLGIIRLSGTIAAI